jgi:hypothetical protein
MGFDAALSRSVPPAVAGGSIVELDQDTASDGPSGIAVVWAGTTTHPLILGADGTDLLLPHVVVFARPTYPLTLGADGTDLLLPAIFALDVDDVRTTHPRSPPGRVRLTSSCSGG